MTEEAIKVLFNYGVLGVFTVLLIVALVWAVKYIKNMHKDQTAITLEFNKSVMEFKNTQDKQIETSKHHTEALKDHGDLLKELTQVIHSKL